MKPVTASPSARGAATPATRKAGTRAHRAATKSTEAEAAKTEQPISEGERFQLLVSAVTDYAIYMLDLSGIVTTWNSGAERAKGYAKDEVIGSHFSRFFTPEDQGADKPAIALRTAAETGRWEDEGWRVRKDGTRFWAFAVLDAIHDRHGKLIGFAKITRDVTEHRIAQQALTDSERKFRLLVASVIDYALFTLNLDGYVETWNSGAARLKGYSAEEIVGKHFSIFYTPEARAAGDPDRVLQKVRTEGRFEGEGWRQRKDGTKFWANVVIDPIKDETGTLIGFTKITRDITERRSLEQAREQLHQAQKMETIGRLTGGVAHDFNNLLTAVSGSLALVREMVSEPRALRLIDTAQRAVSRGSRLTGQLLSFARKNSLQPERANANELIVAFETVLHNAAGQRIDLKLDLEPQLWIAAVDPTHFQSALLNLVVNARDAIGDGAGTISIETRNVQIDEARAATLREIDPGAYVMIGVSDNGKGMGAETRARAIEPFFTTKDVGKGSGLGLSQVYGFTRQSNGQLEIESAPGQGATVRIYIPRLMNQSASDRSRERHGTILVVDDDPDVLTVAVETLQVLGYEVFSAASASEALAILRRESSVDLLFTDIVMPEGRDGITLAREARQLRPAIRVLFSSGYTQSLIEPEAGMAFIGKPYQLPELAQKIQAIIATP